MPYFLLRYQFLRKSTFVTGRDGYKVLFLFLEQYRLMRRVFLAIKLFQKQKIRMGTLSAWAGRMPRRICFCTDCHAGTFFREEMADS